MDNLPHNVPEQLVAVLGPLVTPPDPVVVTAVTIAVVTGIAVGPGKH